MKRLRCNANPFRKTAKRNAALAFLASRGITQPKPVYPPARLVDVESVKTRAGQRVRYLALSKMRAV